MKKVYLLAVIAAVLFGALMYLYLQGSGTQAATPEKTTTVVVATCDIAPDVTITEDMVKEESVAASAVQANALTSKEDAIGQCCPAQIVKGEQLSKHMLSSPDDAGVRLAAQLEAGKRGMTIEVQTDAGDAGYVKAGDYIDLLGVRFNEEGTLILDDDGLPISYTIVENVQVVRVNEATKEGQTPYAEITLSMTEEECAAVYEYQVLNPSGSTTDYHAVLRPVGGVR